jgi:exonuclease III
MKGRWWTTTGPSKTSSKVPELSAFAFNVNGLNRFTKRNMLLAMRREHDWEVLLLSDTKIDDERELQNIDKSFVAKIQSGVWVH